MKNLRKTFFGSVVSLLICFTMLLGTTFAWFTDSVSSVGNKIIAGTLDIELYQYVYDEATDTWSWKDISAVTDALFDYDLWEPGYTEYVVLKVVNNGNLALKWKATFTSTNVLSELADVINVYVNPTAPAAEGTYDNFDAPASRAAALDYTPAGTVRSFVSQIEDVTKGELKANEEACLTLVLQMDPNAGNDYMNLDLGGAFDISIVATQNTVESDDFGTDYDADAVYPGCKHTNKTTTTTYTKTATGHTAVTTEKCDDCYTVISSTTGTEEAHVDTNPADNACDVCGYGVHVCTRASNYAWDNGDDGTGRHYYIACSDADCTNGNYMKKIYEDHIWGENGKCTICSLCKHTTYIWQQYPGTETHRYVCKTCGEPSTGTDGQLVACSDADSDNKCDVCGGTVASAPAACSHVDANHDGVCDLNCGETNLAVSHDGEEITYTNNQDGTHSGVYACGVTAVTNEACAPADGVCAKCENDNTPVTPGACSHADEDLADHFCDICNEEVSTCEYAVTPNYDSTNHTVTACSICGLGENDDGKCEDNNYNGKCDTCDGLISMVIDLPSTLADDTVFTVILNGTVTYADGATTGSAKIYPYVGNNTSTTSIKASEGGEAGKRWSLPATTLPATIDNLAIEFTVDSVNDAGADKIRITDFTNIASADITVEYYAGTLNQWKIANGAAAYEVVETDITATFAENGVGTGYNHSYVYSTGFGAVTAETKYVVHITGKASSNFRYFLGDSPYGSGVQTPVYAKGSSSSDGLNIYDPDNEGKFDIVAEITVPADGKTPSLVVFKGPSGNDLPSTFVVDYVGIFYGDMDKYDTELAKYTTNP